MAKQGFFKDESQKKEFVMFLVASLWILQLGSIAFTELAKTELSDTSDQYYWFTLQDPGGGSLSYPFLCTFYFKLLHLISGENGLLFSDIAAVFSLLFFVATLLVFFKMGLNPDKVLLLSILAQPVCAVLLFRVEIIPIFLSVLAFWLFHSGKKAEGWLALLAGAFFKVFPLFFAPLFLAMELKNFSKGSALRILMAGAISLLAFFMFPDNLRTVLFNSARGIQVESIYSSILLTANWAAGMGIAVVYNYGSFHLVLPAWLDFLPEMALAIQVSAVLVLSALFFLKGARKEQLFVYAFLVAIAMVLFSKVFSAQFMLWPLIFAVPILAAPWESPKIKAGIFPVVALVLSSIFTYLTYPVFFFALCTMAPIGIAVLDARNAFLLAAFIWVFLNREKLYLKTDSK